MFFISGRCNPAAAPLKSFKGKAYLFPSCYHSEISEDNKHFSTWMTKKLPLKMIQQPCFKLVMAIIK